MASFIHSFSAFQKKEITWLLQFLCVYFCCFPSCLFCEISVQKSYLYCVHLLVLIECELLYCPALNTWKLCLVYSFVIVSWHWRDDACSNKVFVILMNLFCVDYQGSVCLYVMYVLCLHRCWIKRESWT